MALEPIVLLSLVGVHAMWVMLPLIPAILIYWLFPNTNVAVSGPLSNLTVKAGGAFAAYLIVFLITWPLLKQEANTVGGFEHPFWTVNGQVKFFRADGVEVHSDDLTNKAEVRLEPPFYTLGSSQGIRVALGEGERGRLPSVRVDVKDWGYGIIQLDASTRMEVDNYNKTIRVLEPITIRQSQRAISGASVLIIPEGRPEFRSGNLLETDRAPMSQRELVDPRLH
jgi:hypothetical protein